MQRIESLNLARGFTVLMIAPVHTVLLYSRLSVHETLMGMLMAFIAEGPGAQLFMLLMGIFFALNPGKGLLVTFKRAFIFMYCGLLLNIFKFVIPHYFGWLPAALLTDLNIEGDAHGFLQLLMIGDILQFASIATIVLFFVYRMPYAGMVSLAMAWLICLLSPFAWDFCSPWFALNYILELMGGKPPQVFFPLFPWLVYPLVGLSLGIAMKKRAALLQTFWLCGNMGWLLILVGGFLKYLSAGIPTSFYRTEYDDTMIHLGIVLVTLSVWEWISQNVKENNFFSMLRYASRNITAIYIIQWILICWLLPVFGYRDQDILGSLFAILLTTSMTLGISFLFRRAKNSTSIPKR